MKATLTIGVKLLNDDGSPKFPWPPIANLIIGKPDLREDGALEFDIAASTTDSLVNFGQVDAANILGIITTQDISIKLNSNSNPAINIKADKLTGDIKYGFMAGTFQGLTSIYISNSGTNPAKVYVLIAS